jgi:hypothetical protein
MYVGEIRYICKMSVVDVLSVHIGENVENESWTAVSRLSVRIAPSLLQGNISVASPSPFLRQCVCFGTQSTVQRPRPNARGRGAFTLITGRLASLAHVVIVEEIHLNRGGTRAVRVRVVILHTTGTRTRCGAGGPHMTAIHVHVHVDILALVNVGHALHTVIRIVVAARFRRLLRARTDVPILALDRHVFSDIQHSGLEFPKVRMQRSVACKPEVLLCLDEAQTFRNVNVE